MKLIHISISVIILWLVFAFLLIIIPLPLVFKQKKLKNTFLKYQTYTHIQQAATKEWLNILPDYLAPKTLYSQIIKENANNLLSLELIKTDIDKLLDQTYLSVKYLQFDDFGMVDIRPLKETYISILKSKNLGQDLPHLTAIIPGQINLFKIIDLDMQSVKDSIFQIHNIYKYFYLLPISLIILFILAWFSLFNITNIQQSSEIILKIMLSVGILLLTFPFIWQFVILGPVGVEYIRNLNLTLWQNLGILIITDLLKQLLLFWVYEAMFITIIASLILLKKRL